LPDVEDDSDRDDIEDDSTDISSSQGNDQ